ncbi:sensor domain-containing diguanylate cyclase [Aliivibrio finisterrensis]|uniref:diguanylate cyclase n=1 Tax=Aliivibrio finisterrensis TaxID=511998 RepID=A0A4Q5KPX1_9GAMM|nr:MULTISPECIES: sensor domain-containing diguanylate cyclase [Aliivibrio]MDD9175304.1 sensor domain-containing diguanylate cyclase [Aliivibrio sp. S3TY1]MDD9192383.1 sensor domain-containing diguanylate cyclase [Aliivibrio sp. S2TY2]RYU47605.1 sensor domain-containing diguanylate cyclase [Aliivibrio finisterrensis]
MKPIHIDSTYGVVIHRNFSPLYADEKYAQMFGFESIDDVMNLNSLFDIIDPKFHCAAQQAYNDVMSGKELPKVRSYANQNVHGEIFSVLTVDHVIEWEGQPALQITVIDMSMIDQANEQILEQEQKYKDLIWHSLQGILVHRDFRPLMINPSFVEIIRAKSVAEVMALDNFMRIIPERNHDYAKNRYQELISGKVKSTNSIVENIAFDGEIRYFHLFESVINWDGEPAVQSSMIDVTEKYNLERQIKYQASHDDLTGLLNRRAISEKITQKTLGISCPSKTCLLIDIDNFKLINDQFGHYAGDEVIKRFSQQCKAIVGDSGLVGRWGGEEFIVFLPQKDKEQAYTLAKRILQGCKQEHYEFSGNKHTVTVSIGISTCSSKHCHIEALIQDADNNMYQAKQQGKNQIVMPE